jgi:ATP-dependent DNA helicase RecQ
MSKLKGALKQFFGFDDFRGEQEKIIQSVIDGKNTFVIMPTGGGKSICYQLPALISEGTAIVISPLIALMKDQVDSIRSYSKDDSIAHVMNSSLNKGQLKQVKEDLTAGKTKLLYVAPETLNKEDVIEFFKTIKLSFVAVDEAHCISEWGHDFRPNYRRIREMIDAIGEGIPVIALTATATPKVQSDIQKNLDITDGNIFISSFNRDNLYYEIRPKTSLEQTQKSIVQIIRGMKAQSGIVYVLSRKSTEEVANILQVNGINAKPYHAGLVAKTRVKTQEEFLRGDIDVIVATIAFGMGIDKPDVRFVIHYDIPKSLENYYQETGRAGRDGLEGNCYAFYSYKDILKLEKFNKDKPVSERELHGQLMEEVVAYSESASCRRKGILHYFGEEYDESGCNKMCDNCKNPKERKEAKDEVLIALNALDATKEKFTIKPLIEFIMGTHSREMKDFGFVENKFFGTGKDQDELYWHSLIRQSMLAGYIRKEIEEYGVLKLTHNGRAFMKKPVSIKIAMNHDYASVKDSDIMTSSNAGTALDDTLFKQLISLRKTEAKKHDVMPWVVFSEPSLKDMATYYPISEEDMLNISGVSKGKARRYGVPFMSLISDYVKANDIERPADMVVKQVANKSKNKVAIIQGIDRKLPFDDIANSVKMDVPKLLEEMNVIVDSGTKLNIDYFLDEIVDEEVLDDIFDYFGEAETDSTDDAFDELKDEDISMEEIQVARIKYMTVHAI